MFFKQKRKQLVEDGERRFITKFCFLPTYVIDGWFWLETITIEQEAFNMHYEASAWVKWSTIKLITQK